MTLFTSNSDSKKEADIKPLEIPEHYDAVAVSKQRRESGAYMFLYGGIVILLAIILLNVGIGLLRYYSLNPFSIERIKDAAAHLDVAMDHTEDEREVVYVMGSSLVHFGFSPDLFDEQLNASGRPTVSYNFGFGNADPSIHEKFARRLSQVFEEHENSGTNGSPQKKKIDRIIYEYAPHGSTYLRSATSGQLNHATTAILSSWSDIGETMLDDPEQAFELINTRVFRSGVPAEAITHMMAMPFRAKQLDATVKDLAQPEPMGDLGYELFGRLRSEWPDNIPMGGWSEKYRGGFPPTASEETMALSAEVMRRLQDPVRMERSRQQRISCCDMLELNIDPKMTQHVIQTIKYAQMVAEDVDIVIMPLNQDIVSISDQGMKNFREAVDEIVKETGVDIVDLYQDPYLGVEYFFDVDHYTIFKGRAKVTELMANYYAADTLATAE